LSEPKTQGETAKVELVERLHKHDAE